MKCRRLESTIAVLLFAMPVFGQDAVFFMWNELVNSQELDEVELLQIAQTAQIELKTIEVFIDGCQETLPESEESATLLKTRLSASRENIIEFLNRYTPNEIEALGATINDRAQQLYEREKQMMTTEFEEYSADRQKGFCAEMRRAVLQLAPAIKVEIEKAI